MKKEDLLLIDAWRHGEISEEDFKDLEARMQKDPELRSAFRSLSHLEDGLHVISQRKSAFRLNFFSLLPGELIGKATAFRSLLPYGLAASLVALFTFWALNDHPADPGQVDGHELASNHYLEFDLPLQPIGKSDDVLLNSSTLFLEKGGAELESLSGAKVLFEGPGTFGLNSPSGGVLYEGSIIARMANKEATYSVETANLRILDCGTEFAFRSKGEDEVELEVLDGEVEVQTLNRMPKFFWNFDGTLRDPFNSVELTLGARASTVKGLVGSGALSFDNQPESVARVEGKTGKMVGTGEMSFSTGISIEALFVSKWSGKYLDYDQIFRKEDGNHRILLCFQNDKDMGDYDTPEVSPGPVLSFGLHLNGFGYEELDMPLDGKEGRPALGELTDGKIHHVVACYDSFTGKKSIFLDGKPVFGHGYPVGTLILSGGPSGATIGNILQAEPFNGVIDELAIYPFALRAGEIYLHANRARDGLPYFKAKANRPAYAQWIPVKSYPMGWKLSFNRLTGRLLDSTFVP
jgi:hypothetical protein